MTGTNITKTLYADLREARFSNTTGSTQLEVNIYILLAALFNISATSVLYYLLRVNQSNCLVRIFIFEFLSCVCPLVISLTFLSDFVFMIFAFVVIVVVVVFSVAVLKLNVMNSWKTIIERTRVEDQKLPCISHFRGVVNLYSAICILGADFTCFPKRFLKTEFYGYSLMDTGVGLFVVALSLSSTHLQPKRISPSTFFRPLILLIFGVGRYLCVHSTNYHHQIFEYGVHWNFFVTIAILAVVNELIFRLLKSVKNAAVFSICLLILYETALKIGLKEWIFGAAPRSTFLSANREGVCSLAGYEVLYLWGVLIRNCLPRRSDSFQKYIKVLRIYSVASIALLFMTLINERYFGISRRCVNTGYVMWITFITLMCLNTLIIFELSIVVFHAKMKTGINNKPVVVPYIMESVNFNGLLFFLIANVLTGAINLSTNTLLVNDIRSVLILFLYIFACCSVTMYLYAKNWRIR